MQEYEKQIPGLLKTKINIELNSKQIAALFYGQEKDEETGRKWIVGLVSFSEMLKQITFAAHNDDPYADWYLVKIEKELDLAKQKIKLLSEEMTNLSSSSLLSIDQGSSVKPITITTAFSSVYANIALELLKRADNLILEIMALRHIGILESIPSNEKISKVIQIMRRAFMSNAGYRYTKIIRKDVLEKTAKYKTAHALMKFSEELPDALLKKEAGSRAKHAPNILLTLNDTEAFKRDGPARRRKGMKTQTTDDNKTSE